LPVKKHSNPATDYANSILSGNIPACLFVKQACERYLRDLERTDIYFDLDKAREAVAYIELLRHTKAEWAGQLLLMEPWQKFILYNIFGFYKKNGTRRFRKAYLEMPKKQGKSPLAAGIACLLHNGEGEPKAEVYCAATQLDQSAIVFEYSFDMMTMFCEEYGIEMLLQNSFNNKRIVYDGSVMKPLAFDPKQKKDGFMVTGAVIDEYHAHPSDAMYDILSNGTAARRNPLIVAITTAGVDRNCACYQHREYCTGVLSGKFEDDSIFAIIYTIDEDDIDNWDTESVIMKANPNYGISVKPDYMEAQIKEARESESKKVIFMIKHLNIWTDAAETWIPDGTWMAGQQQYDIEKFAGQEAFAGLDLASTNDFCSLAVTFPKDGYFYKLYRYYVTDESLKRRGENMRERIMQWVSKGYIHVCKDNSVDYDIIEKDILELRGKYDIKGVAVDPWNSSQLIQNLNKQDINCFQCSQNISSLSGPTSNYDKLIKEGKIQHGKNPVQRWMVGNVAMYYDPNGNMKVMKNKSSDKVDGVVADIMSHKMYEWWQENGNNYTIDPNIWRK
jgi:phage terminase large subunit-like protein